MICIYRLLCAASFLQNSMYSFDMMQHMIALHLDHKANGDVFNFPLWRAYNHSAIPRLWHAFQELKDMLPSGFEQRQRHSN